MNKPSLLTKYEYSDRIDLSLQKIADIDQSIDESSNLLIIEAIFVTLIASFEICLSDLLQMDLLAYPKKLPKLELSFTKEEVLHEKKINIEVNKYIQTLGYKSLEDYMGIFQKQFHIQLMKWSEHKSKLLEFKARRNLLLHNDLIVNLTYLQQSGSSALATESDMRYDKRLKITNNDIKEVVRIILELLTDIKDALNLKMKNATRINTFKKLWDYLFKSKIMDFYDWILTDESEDKILGWKKDNKWYGNISYSETMFIDFLGENFFCGEFPPRDFSQNWRLSYPMMRSLDARRMDDFEFLVANFDDICKVLQRERWS